MVVGFCGGSGAHPFVIAREGRRPAELDAARPKQSPSLVEIMPEGVQAVLGGMAALHCAALARTACRLSVAAVTALVTLKAGFIQQRSLL